MILVRPGLRYGSEGNLLRVILLCAAWVAVLAGAAVTGPPADEGGTTVQLIYHSDTRGYYLPCG